MRLPRGVLALLLTVTPLAARPVALFITPDAADRRAVATLAATLLEQGVDRRDLAYANTADAVAALPDGRGVPELGAGDSLTVVVAGTVRTDAGEPVLAAGDGSIPLAPLLALLARSPAGSVVLVTRLTPERAADEADPDDLTPSRTGPLALLMGRNAAFLPTLAEALHEGTADTDGDGAVTAGELADYAARQLGVGATRARFRPYAARSLPVAAPPAPDTLPPLVLVLSPRLADDGPVLIEQAGPLSVVGIVADDRRVYDVQVNGVTATLSPEHDPALDALGYPGRTLRFEAVVPAAADAATPIEVVARDQAGNVSRERFTVLPAHAPKPPAPAPTPVTDKIDRVAFEWGATEDWRPGFRLVVDATVHNRQGHRCQVAVQFRFAGDGWLRDVNGQDADSGGRVTVSAEFSATYPHARVRGVRLFVPQAELHVAAGQTHRLEALVSLWDVSGKPKQIAVAEPVPFNLVQPAQVASISAFRIEHGAVENGEPGLRLHTRFTVAGMRDSEGLLAVYVQRADGRPWPDRDGKYRAADGSVSVSDRFQPPYDPSEYPDQTLFLPYSQLDLPDAGRYALRIRSVVWDAGTGRALDASPWAYLTVSRP